MIQKLLRWSLIVVGVLLLALILQGVIVDGLIVPLLSYLSFVRLALLSVPQSTYWYMFIAGIALLVLISVMARFHIPSRFVRDSVSVQGPVEKTARLIVNSRSGVYSRWTLANRLGETARNILVLREGAESPIEIRHLAGRDWNPPDEIQEYLEAGIKRSFIHAYPSRRRFFFFRRQPTVYDLDPEVVIKFLESQMEAEE